MRLKSKSEVAFILSACLLIILAIALNQYNLGIILRPDGRIDSFQGKALVWSIQAVFAGMGILLFLLRKKLKWGNIALLLGTSAFCLLLGEAVIRIMEKKPVSLTSEIPQLSNQWSVDSITGLHAVYDNLTEDQDRFNHAGFRDKDEFTKEGYDSAAIRILLLGDSFAYGATAWGEGECFADVLENRLKEKMKAVVWNAGMPGIGQKQEKYEIMKYLPILKPQIVIIAFYFNDITDNVWPAGEHWIYQNGLFALRYSLKSGEVVVLSPEEAYRRATVSDVQYPFKSHLLGNIAQLIGKCIRTIDVDNNMSIIKTNFKEQISLTSDLFREMNDYVEANDSKLFVLIIPSLDDIKKSPSSYYKCMIDICRQQNIEYIEPLPKLVLDDYITNNPVDQHWNKSGHLKVGNMLAQWLEEYIDKNHINIEQK